MIKINKVTLGASLKLLREITGLSVRRAATKAGIAPMYLSLLERDACGPPSDEKLQRLAEVLGEQSVETLFARAGRVTPQVVSTILRHPTEWSEFIEAAKSLNGRQLEAFTQAILFVQARVRVGSVDASMDKEIEAFLKNEMKSRTRATERRLKKGEREALEEAAFWDRTRERLRSVEAFVEKEIETFSGKEMDSGNKALENKGKKRRKLAEGVLVRTSN